MAAHNELGKEGEEAASAYLSSRGYRIRHRNWHVGKLELDIIAEKDGELIVVEVKTRRNTRFGLPEEAVTERKIRRIGRVSKRRKVPLRCWSIRKTWPFP